MAGERNRCVDPADIIADELVAYGHGEAPPAVMRHLERCHACRDQAEEYARMERVLRAGLFRRCCPLSLTIGEYALGTLPAEDTRMLAEHLVECPHCADERRRFSAFLAQPDEPLRHSGIAGALHRLVAQPRPASVSGFGGLRGSDGSESITYTAGGMLLTISVQRAAAGARGSTIAGMIQDGPESWDGTHAQLFAGDRLLRTEDVDDLGGFFFDGIDAGVYRIEVAIPDAIVVIDPLPVT